MKCIFPSNVNVWLIIGGRRWARIIASELCAMLGPKEYVFLLKSPEDTDLLDWWKSSPYKARLKIIEKIDRCPPLKIGVAIVVNSAYLHCSSIESALMAGYNVISEKPLTLSGLESRNLLTKTEELGLKLFSTNTFFFADYLRLLRRDWIIDRKFSHLDIHWADAVLENRYGVPKGYDSSIPIIFDILPHVASIILACHGEVKLRQATIKVSKGGSEVELKVECDDLSIAIALARNSLQRKRLLRFFGNESEVAIDFTEEPGLVSVDGRPPEIADRDWSSKRKPISEMLFCVKEYFEGGPMDNRLSCDVALLGNELIDSVVNEYVDQQIDFLNSVRHSEVFQNSDFIYASKESASLKKRVFQYLPQESPLRRITIEP